MLFLNSHAPIREATHPRRCSHRKLQRKRRRNFATKARTLRFSAQRNDLRSAIWSVPAQSGSGCPGRKCNRALGFLTFAMLSRHEIK